MKKQATNKQALKEEVNDLLKIQRPKDLRSLNIILSYNGKFKIDRYTLSYGSEYNEHYNFSMDTLTEKDAKTFLEDPDTVLVIYKRDNAKHPEWLKKASWVEVPVNDIDLIDVEKFFNYEYTPLVFQGYKCSENGYYNYWDHRNDPDIKWWTSEGRKLWVTVSNLWKERLKSLAVEEEKRQSALL